ncbi:HNH endonuclease [Rhizobium grahamii]|uniref:HNH endonuclease n=2 Tax=Rhizobium grahamii TaxID=1120045 RepID=A0A5Q0C7S6_9HYPH|nr:HNH endonuclease [Rhizobium grahamii]QRM50500.1 HNH endonuclease [Rhizobium sp. BG6]
MNTETRRIFTLILFHRQGGMCCYCRRFMTISYEPRERSRPQAATLEHLHRKADGGRDNRDNFAAACKECNNRRGNRDWLYFTSLKRNEF